MPGMLAPAPYAVQQRSAMDRRALLVGDEERRRAEAEHVARSEDADVLPVEELEARVVPGTRHELPVLLALHGPAPEPVDVDRHRQALGREEFPAAADHVRRELMDHEELLREALALRQGREPPRDLVDLRRRGVADRPPRDRARLHLPLRVERERHVGLLEQAPVAADLVDEARPAGLHVDDEEAALPPDRAGGALDLGERLAVAVERTVAGRRGGDGGDELERGQDLPAARTVIGARLALQAPRGLRRRAAPERAEDGRPRGAVEGDDALAREDRPPAPGQLGRPLLRLRGRLRLRGARPPPGVGAGARVAPAAAPRGEHPDHDRDHEQRPDAAREDEPTALPALAAAPIGLVPRPRALAGPLPVLDVVAGLLHA